MTYDWLETNGYPDEIIEPVQEMWLCEYNAVYLRPNQMYYFKVHPTCDKCKELNVYDQRTKDRPL
jgi:hypothetical protein